MNKRSCFMSYWFHVKDEINSLGFSLFSIRCLRSSPRYSACILFSLQQDGLWLSKSKAEFHTSCKTFTFFLVLFILVFFRFCFVFQFAFLIPFLFRHFRFQFEFLYEPNSLMVIRGVSSTIVHFQFCFPVSNQPNLFKSVLVSVLFRILTNDNFCLFVVLAARIIC